MWILLILFFMMTSLVLHLMAFMYFSTYLFTWSIYSSQSNYNPAGTKRWNNVDSTSRRWGNVDSTLYQRCVPAGVRCPENTSSGSLIGTRVLWWQCYSLRKHAYSNIWRNSTYKNWKFSDKKLWYISYFCSEHRLWVLVRTASARRF